MNLTIPDYLAEQLIATGRELAKQNNLATAWPIWYVTEEKKIYTSEDDAEFSERKDDDDIDPDEDLCPACLALWKENELPNKCDRWRCSDSMLWYDLERGYASYGSTFFLTKKACQKYIDENDYHFNNPEAYAASAFRNDELQPIIQALILMAGETVPSNHYGVVR